MVMVKRLRLEDAIEQVQEEKGHKFEKGHEKMGGRTKGTKNKMPTILKEAIMLALHEEGSDGKGKDGVVGALRRAWKTERREVLKLAAKLLPYQITGKDGSPLQMLHSTPEQLKERFKERELPMPASLMDMPVHSTEKN
jgi:hypothetical protein